jgi:hypothetical protein
MTLSASLSHQPLEPRRDGLGVREGLGTVSKDSKAASAGLPRVRVKKGELTLRASCDMGLKASSMGSAVSDSTKAGLSLWDKRPREVEPPSPIASLVHTDQAPRAHRTTQLYTSSSTRAHRNAYWYISTQSHQLHTHLYSKSLQIPLSTQNCPLRHI